MADTNGGNARSHHASSIGARLRVPVGARSVLGLPPGGHKDQVTDYTPSALYAGEVRSRSGCGPEPGLHDDEAPSEQCQARAEGTGAGLPSALRSRHPLAGAVVSGVELKSSVVCD